MLAYESFQMKMEKVHVNYYWLLSFSFKTTLRGGNSIFKFIKIAYFCTFLELFTNGEWSYLSTLFVCLYVHSNPSPSSPSMMRLFALYHETSYRFSIQRLYSQKVSLPRAQTLKSITIWYTEHVKCHYLRHWVHKVSLPTAQSPKYQNVLPPL